MDLQSINALPTFFLQNPQLVIGIIIPPLIDILNKDIPMDRDTERTLATFVICFLVAALGNVHAIMVNSWPQVFSSFFIIFTESQAVYKLYFKNSFLRSKLLERVYDGEILNPPTKGSASISPSSSISSSPSEVG